MKLFTKIFLQVICVVLLLSSGIFFYTTYRWKNQSIQNINSYENSRFQTNISKFENMLMRIKSKTQDTDDKIREKMIIYAFRQVFHDSAVLYQDGKEQYNGTKYEFDLQNIRNLTKNKHDGFENDIYCDKPLISKTNGNVFLLFYSSSYSSTDMNYQIVTYKDITSVQKQSQTLFYQAGGFTLFLVLFVGFFLFLTLRKIMEPLTRLKEAAVSVANGNYEIKVPAEGKTELAQVGKSFNLMTGKVREQIEKLSSVNQAQRQLLGSLAHELKTPMTAIIGYADTLLTVRLSPKRQEIALDYIRNEFLEAVKKLVTYRLQEKKICLEIHCNPEELRKTFDPDLMMSAVTNFIDNAVKASDENSKIVLEATQNHLSVQDYGKGIPEEDLKRVTEAFYMVDKSRSRVKGSVGLGLALCQKIADIHGFQLEITSHLGKGTIVSVLW